LKRERDSNPRPLGYEPNELATALSRNLAEGVGIEPTRDWLLRTVFKTVATANWLALPWLKVFDLSGNLTEKPHLARMVGLEPTTFGFGDHCATNCATPVYLLIICFYI
jgi:hypothetical protein